VIAGMAIAISAEAGLMRHICDNIVGLSNRDIPRLTSSLHLSALRAGLSGLGPALLGPQISAAIRLPPEITSSSCSTSTPLSSCCPRTGDTVDAARTGGSGSGFAVLGSEVESLASQTAKATDEKGAATREIARDIQRTGRAAPARSPATSLHLTPRVPDAIAHLRFETCGLTPHPGMTGQPQCEAVMTFSTGARRSRRLSR